MNDRSNRKPLLAPRNPLVAAARFRRAGAHQSPHKRERQRARRDLVAALQALDRR